MILENSINYKFMKLSDFILSGGIANSGGGAQDSTLQAILANQDVTAKYAISRDDTSTTTEYYGFVDTSGAWYILQIDTTTGVYLYANGASDFITNWNNRTTLTFDEFNNLTW